MIIVKYFGEIAEKTGKNIEEFSYKHQTVNELLTNLKSKYNLEDDDFQLAINQELIQDHAGQTIKENDELALLSAFAGG